MTVLNYRVAVPCALLLSPTPVSSLGADAPDDALLAASSALYAGVPAATIRRAADARGDRASAPSVALTLTALGALVSRHVSVEVATVWIETPLRRA